MNVLCLIHHDPKSKNHKTDTPTKVSVCSATPLGLMAVLQKVWVLMSSPYYVVGLDFAKLDIQPIPLCKTGFDPRQSFRLSITICSIV